MADDRAPAEATVPPSSTAARAMAGTAGTAVPTSSAAGDDRIACEDFGADAGECHDARDRADVERSGIGRARRASVAPSTALSARARAEMATARPAFAPQMVDVGRDGRERGAARRGRGLLRRP